MKISTEQNTKFHCLNYKITEDDITQKMGSTEQRSATHVSTTDAIYRLTTIVLPRNVTFQLVRPVSRTGYIMTLASVHLLILCCFH